jgi:hypothetical protein
MAVSHKYTPGEGSPIFYTYNRAESAFSGGIDFASSPSVIPKVHFSFGDASTDVNALAAAVVAEAILCGYSGRQQPYGAFWIQHATYHPDNTRRLLTDAADTIASPSPHTPSPVNSNLFTANGVATQAATNQDYLTAIASAFDAAGLPQPRYSLLDEEEQESHMGAAASNTAGTAGGYWTPSLNDARASTEPIVPGYTMQALNTRRLTLGYTYDDTKSQFSTQNATFNTEFAGSIPFYSYALLRAHGLAWKEAFPLSQWGNYNTYCADNAAYKYRDPQNPIYNYPLWSNYADFHMPLLYPPNYTNAQAQGFVRSGESQKDYWIRSAVEHVEACAESSEHHKKIIPTIWAPGYTVNGLAITTEATLELVNQVWARFGVYEWSVFDGNSPIPSASAANIVELARRHQDYVRHGLRGGRVVRRISVPGASSRR